MTARVRLGVSGRVAHGAEDAIRRGLARIRTEFEVPEEFPDDVLAAANAAAALPPSADHVDRTDLPFVTLDPAASTDLDQAFVLEQSGSDIVLRYAIADVGHFVAEGSPVDREAWKRGLTLYLPDGRAGLHPPVLAEAAASLLPDGVRPATLFTVRVDQHGAARLDGVERAAIRSTAKLAYTAVTAGDLSPLLEEFWRRVAAAEAARGATRVEAPEQVVEADGDGSYRIEFRPRLWSEEWNSAMSLATNLAVADALLAARTGLFRVMDEPSAHAIGRLRHTARALEIDWAESTTLSDVERTLDGADVRHAAFAVAIRRAGGGASYAPYVEGTTPWHAAVAATYAHVTAPLRRLADRYVIAAVLAVANSQPVPDDVVDAFVRLPEVMEQAESQASRVERAVIDLVEAAVLQGRIGSTFPAVVTDTDERGARVQLCDLAVVARIGQVHVEAGERIRVKVLDADPERRTVSLFRVA